MRTALFIPLILPLTAQAFEPVATPSVHPWVCGDWTTTQSRVNPNVALSDAQQTCATDADCTLVQNTCGSCWFAVNTTSAEGLKAMFAEKGQTMDCAAGQESPQPTVTCSSGYCRPVTQMSAQNSCTLYGGTWEPNPALPGQMLCNFGSNTGEP
ncbi:MAG: hypothetical protein GC134_06915 [Proteobacteria bacterium]|nr:hypothetical protein [Pseudomonadota bacterium]